jgi:non-homologous end joining protein Ku
MGLHPSWSGNISFGLVTIPIRLYNSEIFKILNRGSMPPRARSHEL